MADTSHLSPTVPTRAEEFLEDVARGDEQERTRRTYRSSLVRLQAYAEAAKCTPAGAPLPPLR